MMEYVIILSFTREKTDLLVSNRCTLYVRCWRQMGKKHMYSGIALETLLC